MKTLLAFPATPSFAQQVARALHERDALSAYFTTFAFQPDGALSKALAGVPGGERVRRELMRRSVGEVPCAKVQTAPFWEVVRTLADKLGASPTVVDRIWDHLSRTFTREAGRRLRHPVQAIYAYEYTALEAFERARKVGVARILDFPSLNSRQFEELLRREKRTHPELIGSHDRYFARKFETRQARRDSEMRLADVIITNSSLTRTSHIKGGADPEKVFAIPYGAPPTLDALPEHDDGLDGRLRVIWAGTFSIRKGAHYLIEAWRSGGLHENAQLDVYGACVLPERMLNPAPKGVQFHGSVPRPVLFDAFDRSDVLIFPTLSDGFGMVVTEAFARGLPVITTDQAGAADLVVHRKNGIIIPAGAAEPIAAALEWCLGTRPQLREMRQAALDTARRWQWSDYRAALIEAVASGLRRAGYSPSFQPLPPG